VQFQVNGIVAGQKYIAGIFTHDYNKSYIPQKVLFKQHEAASRGEFSHTATQQVDMQPQHAVPFYGKLILWFCCAVRAMDY
jgi:hypothetical protein